MVIHWMTNENEITSKEASMCLRLSNQGMCIRHLKVIKLVVILRRKEALTNCHQQRKVVIQRFCRHLRGQVARTIWLAWHARRAWRLARQCHQAFWIFLWTLGVLVRLSRLCERALEVRRPWRLTWCFRTIMWLDQGIWFKE